MRKYCKAYHLRDLRQFSDWKEIKEENEPELTDETVCYLWDDFTVVRSPVQAGGTIFDTITPEWQSFCETTLHFVIPEDLRYAYQSAAESANVSDAVAR